MRALLLLCLCPAAFGQVNHFELALAASSSPIGAPVEITGTATFPVGYRLDTSLAGQPTGSFEILAVETGTPRVADGLTSVPVRLKVAAFALGEQTFPALRWSLRAQDGAQEILSSPPVKLDVTGPKVEANSDIHDIAGPIAPRVWPWAMLAALAAASAGAAAWRAAGRHSAAAAPSAPAPDPRTPDEIALDELSRLASAGVPIKEYYARLSDILRQYFERRYGVAAPRMTSADLARRMARTPAPPEARGLTKVLLDRCDLVKFARYLPAAGDLRKDLDTATSIVGLTREPKPEPASAPGAPS